MDKPKILYISQEITPYLPETELSQMGRMLPQAAQERGFEARTFMPKYGCINERRNQLHEVIRLSGMNIIIDDTDHPLIIKVATLQPARMQVYFIDNDDYFMRNGSKELETKTSPHDNDERIIFFVRGVVETVKKLRWEPVLVHCSGWTTALVPLYLKRLYNEDPSFRNSKVVMSLYGGGFEEALDERFVEKLKLDKLADDDLASLTKEANVDHRALMRQAIDFADAFIAEAADVDGDILEYAKASGKPMLDYIEGEEPDARFDRYAEFYRSIL